MLMGTDRDGGGFFEGNGVILTEAQQQELGCLD